MAFCAGLTRIGRYFSAFADAAGFSQPDSELIQMSAVNANNDPENSQLLRNTFPVDVRLPVDRRSGRCCVDVDHQRFFPSAADLSVVAVARSRIIRR
jgi:hypothetical protein